MFTMVWSMQASKMARLVASLPAGVEEGTLFPQRRPAAGGRCRSAVVQPALPCTPELRKGPRQGREGGQGGVWGRQREGGAVGRQGPAGSLGLARTGRLPAAAASVLVQGGPSRGQTAGAAVQLLQSVCSLVCSRGRSLLRHHGSSRWHQQPPRQPRQGAAHCVRHPGCGQHAPVIGGVPQPGPSHHRWALVHLPGDPRHPPLLPPTTHLP